MKISNSKKQLAKIIHESGGWRDGAEWSVQHKTDGRVVFTKAKYKPEFDEGCWDGFGTFYGGFVTGKALPNWHQTILSRDEYFHLHPAADSGVKVEVENNTSCHLTVPKGHTIEQLAADYRNRKDYADRKQQEADAAKADAEAKLVELVAAGKANGLVLSVATPAKTFHNQKVGRPEIYTSDIAREVCDGCGARAGNHFGRAMFCGHKDSENA